MSLLTSALPQTKHGTLSLFLDGAIGHDVQQILAEAWLVSMKTDMPVRVSLNGVDMVITEHLSPNDAYLLWQAKLNKAEKT